jgi:hypothetical protein
MRVTNVVVFVAANTPVAAIGHVPPSLLAADAFVAAPRAGPLLEPAVVPAVLARVQQFRGSCLQQEESHRKQRLLPLPIIRVGRWAACTCCLLLYCTLLRPLF